MRKSKAVRRFISLALALTFISGQAFAGMISPGSSKDTLAIPLASGSLGNTGVIGEVRPGHIGNGRPMAEISKGNLPPRLTLENWEIAKLQKAIELAVSLSATYSHPEYGKMVRADIRNLIKLNSKLVDLTYLYSLIAEAPDAEGPEHYSAAFGFVKGFTGLTKELVDGLSVEDLAQVVFHECFPEDQIVLKGVRDDNRSEHRVVYKEIQPDIFGKEAVARLGKKIREQINAKLLPLAEAADRRHVIGGNWKMAVNDIEAATWLAQNVTVASTPKVIREADIIIAPSFPHIAAVRNVLGFDSRIKIAAQDVSDEESGAFTGQTSVRQLKDLGVSYIIIGHSERRRGEIQESSALINSKIKTALRFDFKVIVCVGEDLKEFEAGKTKKVVDNQVRESLAGLTAENMKNVIIAYEPVWAIGTGKVATPEQANDVHRYIRGLLLDMFGFETAAATCIQYGGSVKPDNVGALMAKPNIDGALVGGASLKAPDFVKIVNGANAAVKEPVTAQNTNEALDTTLFHSKDNLLAAVAGSVRLDANHNVQEIINLETLKELVPQLYFNYSYSENPEIRQITRNIARQGAALLGSRPSTLANIYQKQANGTAKITLPANNIRMLPLYTAEALLSAAKTLNAGAFLVELARSERGYTGLDYDQLVTSTLFAGIMAGFEAPIHFKLDHSSATKEDLDDGMAKMLALQEEAINAGVYNVDIDASALEAVPAEGVPQGAPNMRANIDATIKAALHARTHGWKVAPLAIITLGGEAGGVGTKDNTTPAIMDQFLTGVNGGLRKAIDQWVAEHPTEYAALLKTRGTTALDKREYRLNVVSGQNVTAHGGIMDPKTGQRVAEINFDFNLMEQNAAVARKHSAAGYEQHGASTVPIPYYGNFVQHGSAEVHLATRFMEIAMDFNIVCPEKFASLSAENQQAYLKVREKFLTAYKETKSYTKVVTKHIDKLRKAIETDTTGALAQKFSNEEAVSKEAHKRADVDTERRRMMGPFKRLWDELPRDVKKAVGLALKEEFIAMFTPLNIQNTMDLSREPLPFANQPNISKTGAEGIFDVSMWSKLVSVILNGLLDMKTFALSILESVGTAIESDNKSVLIFSNKATFGEYKDGQYEEGLGLILPDLTRSNHKVAVIAATDKQRALINDLNKDKPENEKIFCAASVDEVTSSVHGAARYYYFKTADESPVDGVTNINIIVRKILEAIGRVIKIDRALIDKMHEAARLFAIAA